MATKFLRLGPFELVVLANDRGFSIRGAISCRLWGSFYNRLRRWRIGDTSSRKTQERAEQAVFDQTQEQKALMERVRTIQWYHSIDLDHQIVTPGLYDHRQILAQYYLPERMDGLRVLDVGTFDGFWAFEFEKRGANEVVAMDIEQVNDLDLPPTMKDLMSPEELSRKHGKGFAVAHEIRKSQVRREVLNVYDLSAARVGKFDIVHIGDILLHLMNPMKALQRVFEVTAGYALISECFSPDLDRLGCERILQYCGGATECTWWSFSLGALEQMIFDAGFQKVELVNRFKFGPQGKPGTRHHAVFRAFPRF